MKSVIQFKLLFLLVLLNTSCNAQDIDFRKMDEAESQLNKQQMNNSIFDMPLEDIFHNEMEFELAKAASQGDVQGIFDSLQKGARINAVGIKGITPLFAALRELNQSGFEYLLDRGGDPNMYIQEKAIMHWVVGMQDPSFLQLALEYGGDPNLRDLETGATPIFKTINIDSRINKVGLRKLLIDYGADVNAKTIKGLTDHIEIEGLKEPVVGRTPLMQAAIFGRIDIVRELLDYGANPSMRDSYGKTVLDYLYENKIDTRFPVGSNEYEKVHTTLAMIKKEMKVN